MSKRSNGARKPAGTATGAAAAAAPAPDRITPTQEEIEKLAYQFWVEGGCREGTALSDWLRAEEALGVKTAA